jgi:hypothetical protein
MLVRVRLRSGVTHEGKRVWKAAEAEVQRLRQGAGGEAAVAGSLAVDWAPSLFGDPVFSDGDLLSTDPDGADGPLDNSDPDEDLGYLDPDEDAGIGDSDPDEDIGPHYQDELGGLDGL